MTVDPKSWPEAAVYFRFYSEGRHDNLAQLGYIYARDEIRESADRERLYIGRAGTDGIEFIYRRGSPGIWAYYPIGGDTEWKADTIEEFELEWRSGKLKV